MVNLSQLSQGSASSTECRDEEEEQEQNRLIVEKALQSYVAKQRKEIKILNRAVAKTIRERDVFVKELQANSLQLYEIAVKNAQEYFAESKDTVTDLCKDIVSKLDKSCHSMLEGLNLESEEIDPDDAEYVADHLAADFSDEIDRRARWRRQVVNDNYNELKEKEKAIQNGLNADEVVKATMVIMKANVVV